MKKLKSLILILIVILGMLFALEFLPSCSSPQKVTERKCARAEAKFMKASYKFGCPLIFRTDSVFKTVTLWEHHDTTIFVTIKGDTVKSIDTVYIKDNLAQTREHRLDTEFAYSVAYVFNGLLYHTLYQKPSVIAKTIKDAMQTKSHIEYQTITKTVTKTTNIIKPWQNVQIWLGRIFLAFGLSFFIYGIFALTRRV